MIALDDQFSARKGKKMTEYGQDSTRNQKQLYRVLETAIEHMRKVKDRLTELLVTWKRGSRAMSARHTTLDEIQEARTSQLQ
jgi:hypothetical protein